MSIVETRGHLAFLLSVLPRKDFQRLFSVFERFLDRYAHHFRVKKKSTIRVWAVVPTSFKNFAIRFDKWEVTVRTNYVNTVGGSKV